MPAKLGVGVVYVPGLEPLLMPGASVVDVIEIEPQTVWNYKANAEQPYVFPDHTLQHLQQLPQPKIVHSVGFAVGGTQRPDPVFVQALSNTIESLDAAWVSEHLSFTHVNSGKKRYQTGFMLPPLQTLEGVSTAVATIKEFSSQLSVPLAVETTVNYLKPRTGELSDGEFVALTVDQADCEILLDLHNIWTNEINGRQSVKEFLATIPLDRVCEVHLGGGFEFEGFWLDAHSGAVPEPVMMLLDEIMPSLPNLRAVIYEIFPSFVPRFGIDAVQRQLESIKSLWNSFHKNSFQNNGFHNEEATTNQTTANTQISINSCNTESSNLNIQPYLWEQTLGELITNGHQSGPLTKELEQDPSISLVKKLIWRFRAGAIVKSLSVLTNLIILHSGNELLEDLLTNYFEQSKPEPFASEEAIGFILHLRHRKPDIPYLQDILSYEQGNLQALIQQKPQIVSFDHDPCGLLNALINGKIPNSLRPGSFELELPVHTQPSSDH